MQIDLELILKLENLAKLELSTSEREKIGHDLTNILGMVEKLKELDTANVEPLVYISPVQNNLRDDVVGGQVSNEVALSNAPERQTPYFKVPKVL